MKIDPKILFNLCGINCTRVTFDVMTKTYDSHEVVAAFVTEKNISAVRDARRGQPKTNAEHYPDVRYGDVLMSWVDANGKACGMRAAAGMDAGIQVSFERDGKKMPLPFTGRAMLSTREQILDAGLRSQISDDQKRVLSGIQGVLDVILADPDPKRFPPRLIGQAFASIMIDRSEGLEMPVTDEEFGRKARADLLRAKIAMIDPRHKDALSSAGSLHSVIDAAIGRKGVIGAPVRSAGGTMIDEAAMRRMILSSDKMTRDIFGTMTIRDISKIPAAPIQIKDFEELCEKLEGHKLSGDWIDGAQARIQEITNGITPGYSCQIQLFSISGIDILTIQDAVSDAMGAAYIYSWPTAERITVASTNHGLFMNLSPEEIPNEDEIDRLSRVFRGLAHGPSNEAGIDIMSMIRGNGEPA